MEENVYKIKIQLDAKNCIYQLRIIKKLLKDINNLAKSIKINEINL